jgi:hypothetical protein
LGLPGANVKLWTHLGKRAPRRSNGPFVRG